MIVAVKAREDKNMKINQVRFEILVIIGRLLRLQGSVTTRQIKRRMIEKFGDRDYIKNQVQVTLKYLVEQRVLKRVEVGLFELNNGSLADDDCLLQMVLAKRDVVPLQEVENHPIWQLVNFDKSCLQTFHRFNLGLNQTFLEVV